MIKIENFQPTNVDKILIEHSAFQQAMTRITDQMVAAEHYLEPTCLAIIGESRAGKSRLAETITELYPRIETDEITSVPVLMIKVPSKPSVKSLVETFLSYLGDPMCYKRGTEHEKTERLYELLQRTKTHTVILDEFHHFVDKVAPAVRFHLTDWLKIFVDRSKLTIIVVGLESCTKIINQNQQLRGRFLAPIHMRRFNWENEKDRGEFLSCLEAFQNILDRFEMPDLDSDEVGFRFYCAAGGLIGYVAKILHQACLRATINGSFVITMKDLANAYEFSVWMVDELIQSGNPFLVDLNQPNAGTLLLHASSLVGMYVEEEDARSESQALMKSSAEPSEYSTKAKSI